MDNNIISKNKKLPIIITFDDGYKDNLDNALPILEKYSVPATIYIVTNFINSKEMWWYELWEIIEKQEKISFTFDDKIYFWEIKNYSKKYACFISIDEMMMRCNPSEIDYIKSKIRNGRNPVLYDNLYLSWNNIKYLSDHDLITIGSHSVNHYPMAQLTNNQINHELVSSKNIIEGIIKKPVNNFAFPFGNNITNGLREEKMVRNNGYKSSVCTTMKRIDENNDSFSLPRHAMTNYIDENILEVKLSGMNSFFNIQWS